MKSDKEAQAEAPESKPKPMSALSPLHEREEEKQSYRLPDLFCNGLCGIMPRETAGGERYYDGRGIGRVSEGRNTELLSKLKVLNPNDVDSTHRNGTPYFLGHFGNLFMDVSAMQRPNPAKTNVQIGV